MSAMRQPTRLLQVPAPEAFGQLRLRSAVSGLVSPHHTRLVLRQQSRILRRRVLLEIPGLGHKQKQSPMTLEKLPYQRAERLSIVSNWSQLAIKSDCVINLEGYCFRRFAFGIICSWARFQTPWRPSHPSARHTRTGSPPRSSSATGRKHI